MRNGSSCDCLICRLEIRLITELESEESAKLFREFAKSSLVLSRFPSALELALYLHRQAENQIPSSDDVLRELLWPELDPHFYDLWQRLFLLVFIPAIHRTTTQIVVAFPVLTRDDIAQHLITVLLEYLASDDLRSRRTHLAFALARKVRRRGFRWAIHESCKTMHEGAELTPNVQDSLIVEEHSESELLLDDFLDRCERRGWLCPEERELLVKFKLQGISGPELSRRNGHSAVAIRHRIQRLMSRLRRIARSARRPEQLDLFEE